MTRLGTLAALSLGALGFANGQGRPLDWPFFGGDAQRSGWEKSDLRISKENVKDFQLVLKHKLEQKGGPLSLTPPVVLGNLISYKGFKELGFLTGSSGEMWSLDLDIDRMFWHKQLTTISKGCAGGAMATPTLTPPPDFTERPRPAPASSPSPGIPSSPAGAPTTAPRPSILGSTGFGAPRPAFALSKDGKLHVLNTSTGDDLTPAFPFVPPNSRASNLVIADGTLYTTTEDCAGKNGTVWALDLNGDDRKVTSYELKGSATGVAGITIGKSHTVYVAGSDGSLFALASKTLKPAGSWGLGDATAPPLVFTAKDRDMLIVPDANGRLSLVDSKPSPSLMIYTTPPIGKLWGGISSWLDTDETRYIAVPVWGPISSGISFPVSNGPTPDGSLAVFKVEDAKLTPVWVSRNLKSPEPPVITSGVVFVVAAGGPHATFYAFDGATGQEMYSSKDQVTAPANLNGMSLANGRVFFTTTDGTLYGFGIFLDVLGR